MRRQQRLIDINRLLGGGAVKAQTDEELWAAMESWVAQHNAKYNAARQLGLNAEG